MMLWASIGKSPVTLLTTILASIAQEGRPTECRGGGWKRHHLTWVLDGHSLARGISMLRPTRQNRWTTLGKMEQAFWGREGGGVLEQDWIEPGTARERGMAYFRILIETRVFMAQKLAGPQIRLRSNKFVPKSFLKHHPNHLLQRFSMSFPHLKKIAMLLSLC